MLTVSRRAECVTVAALVVCCAAAVGAAFGLAGAQAGLLLGAVLIGAVAAYLLAWPEAGAVLGIFLIYSGVPAIAINDHGIPQVAALGVPLMLAAPLASRLVARQGLIVSTGFRWLLVLLVVQVLAAMFAEHPVQAQEKVVTFLIEGIAVYFLVTNVLRTPDSLRRAMWSAVVAATLLAFVAALQQFTSPDQYFAGFAQLDRAYFVGKSDVIRAQGPVAEPNYFAQILLVALVFALILMWRGRGRLERIGAAAAVVVCVTGFTFTYSRGGAVALFVVLAALAFFRYLRVVHIAGVVIAVALVLLLVPGYSDRIGSLSSVVSSAQSSTASSSDDLSAASRATENKAALLVFRDHPLLGVGQGGFPLQYQDYAARVGGEIHTQSSAELRRSDINAGLAPEREAHNFFLGIAADTGIAGLLGYSAIIGVTLLALLRARRRWVGQRPDLEGLATAMLLAVTGYMVASLFLSLAFERYFWLLMGLADATAGILLRWQPATDVPSDGLSPHSEIRTIGT